MADKDSTTPASDPAGTGRREGDRRRDQQPPAGEDRRKGERRSGADRRTTPRTDSLE